MTQLRAPGGTSQGLTRLGRDAQTQNDDLGPLADLVGTWIGSQGWELIAVPAKPESDFRLIVRPYIEVITFEPIGAPVPDRGGAAGDLFLTGVMYTMRVADKETNEPLHLEAGMWFYMAGQEQEIARSSTIPHGDALLALGNATTTQGPPTFPDTSAIPNPGPDPLAGYTDPYLGPPVDGFAASDPNHVLAAAIEGLDIVQTTTLDVSTAAPGGILNIPFVNQNANATQFTGTYWLETVADQATGDQVVQLQYTQQTNIEFLPQFGNPDELIMWPHVNVNTLRKQ
ncbi:MAG TPA: heme-binding protein [Thermoleophilaceae bacterium]